MAGKSETLFQKVYYPLIALSIATAIEFAIAFSSMSKLPRVTLFILLTFVKVYYIVGFFMHLKYEKKTLINSVVVPSVFIIVLIIVLLYEASQHHFPDM
jgi:cytochrome c oxidase subunit IV